MKVPGDAWLEWTMDPEGDGTRLVQKARFHPRGVWGRVYWYTMLPFHHLIFRGRRGSSRTRPSDWPPRAES